MLFSPNEFFNLILFHAQKGSVEQCALLLNGFEDKIHPKKNKEDYNGKFVALMGSLMRKEPTQHEAIDFFFPYLSFDTPHQKTYFLTLAVNKQSIVLIEKFLPVSDYQSVHDGIEDEKSQQFLKAAMEKFYMNGVIPDVERANRPIKKI